MIINQGSIKNQLLYLRAILIVNFSREMALNGDGRRGGQNRIQGGR